MNGRKAIYITPLLIKEPLYFKVINLNFLIIFQVFLFKSNHRNFNER